MNSDAMKSLAIKVAVMILTALATQLHVSGGAGDITALATDLVDAGFLIYGVYRSYGMKIVPHSAVAIDPHTPQDARAPVGANVAGKVVGALLIASALSAFLAPAFAGDIAAPVFPIKTVAAPTPATCSATGCSGAFLGAEFSGSGTGINVLNLGALSANGNYMGAGGGYQFFNGTYWLSAEVEATYDVAPPTGLGSGGFSNKLFAFEGVEVGGYLSSLFNLSPINLPGPLAGAVPTIKIGACQNGSHLSGYCAGAAAHFFIPNSKFTVDVSYLNAQYGPTAIAPGTTANTENRGSFGFSYHF